MQVGTCFRMRDENLKTKTRHVTQTLKPDIITQSRFKPLVPCISEPLKKLKSSYLQMFFKIDSIKNFAILKGKHLCWSFFFIKLQA